MRVSRIIADIDYIEPRGSISKYKNGVQNPTRFGPELAIKDRVQAETPNAIESILNEGSLSDLKAELSKAGRRPHKTMPKVETVGQESGESSI